MRNINLHEFAEKYIEIKNGDNVRRLNNIELERIKQFQTMLKNGIEFKIIKLRKGTVII